LTIRRRFGVEHIMYLPEFIKKCQQTYFEKTGYRSPSQNPEVKEKKIATSLSKWGVSHPMQNEEVYLTMAKASFSFYPYTLPSGNIIKIQGYEDFALDDLLSLGILEEDIITERTEVPEIWWYDDQGKKHRYIMDIFIKSLNMSIEVKSTHTYSVKIKETNLKKQATTSAGYYCQIWVYNDKGHIDDIII
ncbi:MAG: hypothetical protein WD512_15630, partial [Candidatus Paceibacterota bacterium]